MNWFYNFSINKLIKTVEENEIGQIIESYKKGKDIQCDIQPITEEAKINTWGNSVKSQVQVFCDEILEVDDYILFNGKTYQVEKKVDWVDYGIYAIQRKEVDFNA